MSTTRVTKYTEDPMPDLDLKPIMARYSKALDAKPGKGPISEAGIAAITDSVCDVPGLLAEVERLREQNTRYATRLATYRESMQQQLDPMFATLAAMREILAGDWSPEAPGEWELNAERVRVLRELLGVTS